MALTNAQRQAKWRDSRNEDAQALKGKPKDIAESILMRLGAKEAARVVRALDKRLRNIKPDCPRCKGEGFYKFNPLTPCGSPMYGQSDPFTLSCDCLPDPPPRPQQWQAILYRDGDHEARTMPPRDAKAEAEADAEEWRTYIAGLKRKPKGTVIVVTTDHLGGPVCKL
jgi:hypothetical protein